MKKVQDVMTKDPACCDEETDLQTVAEMMCEKDCGVIPVVDNSAEPKLVGIITDRDIACRTVALGKNPLRVKARECMTRSPVSVKSLANIDECLRIMEEHQIRRIPVVEEDGRCVGIVSQADIARQAPLSVSGEILKEISQPRHVAVAH